MFKQGTMRVLRPQFIPIGNVSILVGGGLHMFGVPKNIMTATFGVVGL